MKKSIKLIFLLSLIAGLVFAGQNYYGDRFLFSLKAGETPLTSEQCASLNTPYPELNKLITKYHVTKIEPWLPNARPTDHDGEIYLNRIYRMTTNSNVEAPVMFMNEIKNVSPFIGRAEQEPVMRIMTKPDDPMIGSQWYLTKSQAKDAWKLWDLEEGEQPGDHKIVIAIVDDGVEYTHPDLWKNIWINQDEIPSEYFSLTDTDGDGYITATEALAFIGDASGNGTTDMKDVIASNSLFTDNVDNDGDGYIDNIIGWDTDAESGSSDDDNNPMVTDNSHGTHVAGLAGAVTDNGVGVASIAYNVSIMPVKATGDETTNSINTGWDGILYAAHAGADIINCSWGGPGYSSYAQNIINNVYNNYGSLIVAAAGNGDDDGNPSDTPHYPSGYDHVVSVTAVSASDVFSWANYGAADPGSNFWGVDLSAPGESMLSTYLTKENSYTYLNGTSMASPMVASCFALLKSAYPDSTNDWLVERMLSNTDPIDDKNPDYAGQLGTGRINILKALASDKWPKLTFATENHMIVNDDGDNILNPGESIDLFIELKNDTGWTVASNVRGVLRSDEGGITIIDSIGTWDNIPANTVALNSQNGFTVQFSNELLPDQYHFTLELVSNEAGGYPYTTTVGLNIEISLSQAGFPFYTGAEVESSPLFVDMNEDGYQEIIFGDKSGNIFAVDHLGDTLSGFPVSLGSQTGGIAVADIDLDDTLEIVATGFNKLIRVIDVYGHSEWTRHAGSFVTAMPAIGNLDADPELEIVVGSYDQKIYVLNHDSTDVTGFPYASGQMIHAGVSLADVNEDGRDEIIYLGKSGQLAILTTEDSLMNGWPVTTSGSVTSEPQVLVNGSGSAIILFGNDMGDMYGFDLDGTQRFMIDGTGAIKASPAIYGEGDQIYAFFGTSQGYIYKVDVTGNTLETGWPKEISPVNQSLVIADVINDDSNEPQVFAMGNDGFIYAYTMSGTVATGFPVNTGLLSKSALAITDMDQDNDHELIAGNYSGISVTDIKASAGLVHWPMHRGAKERKGSVSTTWTDIVDMNVPNDFELMGNYPNPFNPMTSIRYRIDEPGMIDLNIYDLSGRKVLNTMTVLSKSGVNEIRINMENLSSGVYIYSLVKGDIVKQAKMILLK